MSLLQDEAVVGMEIETLIATDRDQGSGGNVEFILDEPVSYVPSLDPLSVTVWSASPTGTWAICHRATDWSDNSAAIFGL